MKRFLLLFSLAVTACADPVYDNYDQACENPRAYDGDSDALERSYPQSFSIVLSPVFKWDEVRAANEACSAWEQATDGAVHCWAYQDDDFVPDSDAVIAHKCPRPLKFIGSDVATYPSNFALPEVLYTTDSWASRPTWQHELCHVFGLRDYDGDEPSVCIPYLNRMAPAPTERDVREFRKLWTKR